MVARGNIQARQRLLKERLTGLDPKVLAVYERMHARELEYREQVFELYPAIRVNKVPDRDHGSVCTNVVRRWLRERRIFAFIHRRHFWFPAFEFSGGEPKPVVRDILLLIQPVHGWEAMFWFVGTNGWLESGAPVDHMDRDPATVVLAASHANDVMSD
jgi:hypothetical protein